MPLTEQDLRESLRRATDAPPHVADRVGSVERRVRRRRRRVVVGTAIAVIVALAAVPLVRWLPDRLSRNEIANSDITPQQMDAMMKYATFVSAWTVVRNGPVADTGVVGVAATMNLPPFNCIVATPEEGQPQGTQAGWVLAQPSVFTSEQAAPTAPRTIITSFVLWPTGTSSCDPAPSGTVLAAPYSRDPRNLIAWDVAFSQALNDPSRPALDIPALYASIPQDRITDVGRQAFEGYQSVAPKDYGTDKDKVGRVLNALGSWIGVALSFPPMSVASPVTGPLLLTAGPRAGSAQLPDGYTARWDESAGTFCVQGESGSSGMLHVSQEDFVETGVTVTPLDGPCPTR
jgi:hypothetical protein